VQQLARSPQFWSVWTWGRPTQIDRSVCGPILSPNLGWKCIIVDISRVRACPLFSSRGPLVQWHRSHSPPKNRAHASMPQPYLLPCRRLPHLSPMLVPSNVLLLTKGHDRSRHRCVHLPTHGQVPVHRLSARTRPRVRTPRTYPAICAAKFEVKTWSSICAMDSLVTHIWQLSGVVRRWTSANRLSFEEFLHAYHYIRDRHTHDRVQADLVEYKWTLEEEQSSHIILCASLWISL
jgi:hypothetical protein